MDHMKRLSALLIVVLLIASIPPSAMAATYIIEHDGELDRLARARASRSVPGESIMAAGDMQGSYSSGDLRYRYYRYDDAVFYERDDYLECTDDAKEKYADDDPDYDKYRDEIRECERRHRLIYRYDGPLRSFEWFYEWKFNPKTFLDRYCPPHLHRHPVTDGPTWYEVTWVHDCMTHTYYSYRHDLVTRPRYERASTIIHYGYESYAIDDPETIVRPEYRRQDSTVRYSSNPVYPTGVRRHTQTEPELERTYSATAYSQIQEYCENNRATDGSMSKWCHEREHLWS